MADQIVTSQDPILFTVDGSINSAGEVVADLRPGAGGGLLAANNLSDVASATTSLTNLGGTTVGRAVFTAANAAAVWTALGLGNYVDDAAAAAGGVAVGEAYHTAGVLKTRMI